MRENNEHRYDDIINEPHYQSATRPQMNNHDRAAQFAPFAALTGYDDAVKETARITDTKIELEEYEIDVLNERLNQIQETLDEQPEVFITYFIADKKKLGGSYKTVTGMVKKIDEFDQYVLMQNGLKIPIIDICEIDGEMFKLSETI